MYAQTMGQIRRQLQGEQHIVQFQVLANVLAQLCGLSQFQQTAVIVIELQLFGGAQHALAFHAPDLAQFDGKRFAVFTRRQ